jgi:hypothetical protein
MCVGLVASVATARTEACAGRNLCAATRANVAVADDRLAATGAEGCALGYNRVAVGAFVGSSAELHAAANASACVVRIVCAAVWTGVVFMAAIRAEGHVVGEAFRAG